jgi:2-hydroxychromene-2-carboxylate isomerase
VAAALDFWFDFGSTYSYPAALRVRGVAEAAGIAVRFRPFMLGAIFRTQGWETSPFNLFPAKGRYMWHDLARITSRMGVPFVRPDPFPQNGLLAARVGVAAAGEDWQPEFCVEVFKAEFARGEQIIAADVVGRVLERVGAKPERWLEEAAADRVKDRLRAETEEALRLGIFGAPTFVTRDGELFWGNDRLEEATAAAGVRAGRTT